MHGANAQRCAFFKARNHEQNPITNMEGLPPDLVKLAIVKALAKSGRSFWRKSAITPRLRIAAFEGTAKGML